MIASHLMSLLNVDIESALRRMADRRIEEAMREGKFDNLAGKGKPLDLEPLPADEKARMMWWALRIMKTNNVVPDEVTMRKALDEMKSALPACRDETELMRRCDQINALVKKINTLGTNAIDVPAVGVDVEEVRETLVIVSERSR